MNTPSIDLTKFTSPLFIPLPPSPPPKPRLPSRKPSGWISSVPRLPSSRFTSLIQERQASNSDRRRSTASIGESRGYVQGDHASRASRAREVSAGTEGTLVDQDQGEIVEGEQMTEEETRDRSGSPRRVRRAGNTRGTQGGRRVSGAMQYALLPLPPPSEQPPILARSSQSPTSARVHARPEESQDDSILEAPSTATSDNSEMVITPLTNLQDIHDEAAPPHIVDLDRHAYRRTIYEDTGADQSFHSVSEISDDPDEDDEDEGELDRPAWLDEVLAERQADEKWMGYVRNQLNALFPDFFEDQQDHLENYQPKAGSYDQVKDGDHLGRASQSTFAMPLSSTRIPSHEPTYVQNRAMMSTLSLRDPLQAGREAADHIPGMREEMGYLREEIERLRGVVGGLAEGLQKGRNRDGDIREAEFVVGQISVAGKEVGSFELLEKDNEGDIGDIEELLVQNADQVISLVKALHAARYPGQKMTTLDLLQRGNLVRLQQEIEAGRDKN